MPERLNVWRENTHIGVFLKAEDGRIGFEYDDDAPATPISLSMPRDGGWTRNAPLNFLDNMIPESPGMRYVMGRDGRGASDPFTLLDGADAPGGLTFDSSDEPPAPMGEHGRIVSEHMIADRIAYTKNGLPSAGGRSGKVSLAGAQAKFAYSWHDGHWRTSDASMPSTHIFKPESPRTRDAEQAEAACMRLSALCDIETPKAEVRRFDDQTTYCVERFDRKCENGRIIRIQCEDLLQAMGGSILDKYGVKAKHVIGLLRKADPSGEMVYQWIAYLAFNTGINNVDAHAKNYSILLDNRGMRLAPMYDAMTTTYWGWVDPTLAMLIGGNRYARQVAPRNWETLAEHNGLDAERVVHTARTMAGRILAHREEAFADAPRRVRDGLMRQTDLATMNIQPIEPDGRTDSAFTPTGDRVWVNAHERNGRHVEGYWRSRPSR